MRLKGEEDSSFMLLEENRCGPRVELCLFRRLYLQNPLEGRSYEHIVFFDVPFCGIAIMIWRGRSSGRNLV